MSQSATQQLKRILHLIPHLADEQEHSLGDLASSIGVSPSQLMTDFISISERFDAPGGFVEGVTIFVENDAVSVHANHFHRPMRLTMPELCAMELGLVMLRRERTPAEQPPTERALERLRQTISRVPTNDRHEGTRYAELAMAGSAEHLAILRGAYRSHHKVRLRYRSGGANEASERTICPHAVIFAEQMWYVVAMCDDAVARFFRLDRVEDVHVLDDTFEPDTQAVHGVMERGKPFASDTLRYMTVRYSPRIARWVAEREGKPLAADGSLTLDHPVADDAWAVRHVLQYGPEAELLEPADLRTLLDERLSAMQVTAIA
jgi:predicted DNA-binding transcriptional regulator YafY